MTRRYLMLLVLGGLLVGGVTAFAASLGTVTTDPLGSGDAVVASCDTDGVHVGFAPGNVTNGKWRIHSVMVSGVAPACAGSSIDVILTKDGNRIAYGQGIANATTTTYMIAVNDGFGGQPSAEDINDVHVLIR